MSDLPQPPRPPGRQPLDYAPPAERGPAGGVGFLGQMAIGAGALAATVALLFAWFALYPTASVGGWFLMLGLAILNIWAAGRWRWPGFVAGCVTMVGVALLVGVGLCFYALGHLGH